MAAKSTNDDLSIRISGLSNGLHEYRFVADPGSLGLDEAFRKPIEVDARLDKTTRHLALRVEIRTIGHFQCDRCLDEFDRAVTTGYGMIYVYDQTETGRYPPEEIQVLAASTTHLTLVDDVRQVVLLSIPLKLLCNEECRGLCPQCGTNFNRSSCACRAEMNDPRWDGLRNMLKN